MSRLDVTEYGISTKTGFMLENPLKRLPPYFDPWNNVSSRFAELVINKTLRDEVEKLPVLDIAKLNDDREVKLAHLQLALMTTGYLFQNGQNPAEVPKVLPKCLAVPLYGLFEKYDLRPGVTYADMLLNNAILKDPNGPREIGNIAAIYDIPGEEWDCFFTVSAMEEYEFGKAVPAIQNVLDGIDEMDETKIAMSLKEISKTVKIMQEVSTKFHEMTTEGFLKVVELFGSFDGVIFEGVKEEPVKFKGPNAGQTSTMKVLDKLLCIDHPKDRTEYVEEIMKYIPPGHRNFIKALGERPKQLKPLVEASSNSELKKEYQSLIETITKFRSYHVQLVTKFFVQAIKKNSPPDIQEQLKPVTEFTMQFVKGMRDDSKQTSL